MGVVYGFGVNDSNYVTRPTVKGKIVACKAYTSWVNMLKRAYCKSYQSKNPTYVGVRVCDDWKSFMAFRGWWLENHIDGFSLDKDLIGDGKLYSPDSCIYIPQWLNSFLSDRKSSRGEFPIGVYFDKQKGALVSMCSNPITGKRENLGTFCNEISAYNAWKKRKIEIAELLRVDMDLIDDRIYAKVINLIKSSK